jgi:hypothetical protein
LKYFEQEALASRSHPAGGGAPCQNAVVGYSGTFTLRVPKDWCWRKSKARLLIAIRAHNRNLILSIAGRKPITDKFKVHALEPLNDRIKVLTELGTIGATSPGAVNI